MPSIQVCVQARMEMSELVQKLGVELDMAKEEGVQETYVATVGRDSVYISKNIDSEEATEYPFIISGYALDGMMWMVRKLDAICGVKHVKFENGSICTRGEIFREDF